MVDDGAFSHKIDYVTISKSQKAPKLHEFKSYDNFADWVDLAYWCSCIRKSLRRRLVQLNPDEDGTFISDFTKFEQVCNVLGKTFLTSLIGNHCTGLRADSR